LLHSSGTSRPIVVPYGAGRQRRTDTLRFASLALAIRPSDEMITMADAFIATAEAITQAGGRVRFVDVDPETIRIRADAVADARSDSGGIRREGYWLGVPCVTARAETEWMQIVELGANRLVAPSAAAGDLGSVVTQVMRSGRSIPRWERMAFGAGNPTVQVADAIRDRLGSRIS
jgi:DegT/DnrJ/EryC1/StrS aminotransferase family/UDP-N-acetylglucosamine 2-epimerase